VLQDRQALVVIHGEHAIVSFELRGNEERVRGQRPGQGVALPAQLVEDGSDDLDLFAAQIAGFAGMRIEPGDADPRPAQSEAFDEVEEQHAQRALEARASDPAATSFSAT
jgi:hypothetical protein